MILTTPRLILRDFTEADFPALRELDTDPRVWRYRGGRIPTEAQTRTRLQRKLAFAHEQPRWRFSLAITSQTDQRLIGTCTLKVANPDLREAELGYALHHAYWGQGMITEAAAALVAFGFHELHLHRVYATCDPENIGSWRVMEKLGMRREAHHRECAWVLGAWRDVYVYAILDHEWSQDNK